jgi:hypothetical protein
MEAMDLTKASKRSLSLASARWTIRAPRLHTTQKMNRASSTWQKHHQYRQAVFKT